MVLDVAFSHRQGMFDLDMAFATDERGVVALFGPSGCGKTTTVNAVAGLLRPNRGRIVLDGKVLLDTATRIFLPPRRRRVGYVFQDARLFPHLTVRGNLLFGWKRTGRTASDADIAHVIEMLGVRHLLDRRPRHLSGGERQRVALGRALLADPAILLLDEPLAGLDAARRAEILPFLERLRDEARVPMIYVSHSIDEVTRLADSVVVMNDGKVAAHGPVGDIMARLDLFPLTGRFEAGAVIDAVVEDTSGVEGLSTLRFDGGRLVVPETAFRQGTPVRARIRARDVILAVSEPTGTSVNNALASTVVEIREDPRAYADVLLSCGEARLIARLTRASVSRLGLAPGKAVHALVKSINIEVRPRRAGAGVNPAPDGAGST